MDRQTDGIAISVSHISVVTRDKNFMKMRHTGSGDVSCLLFAAESNSGIAVELTVDGGSTTQMTDATDEENLWSRRQKHCKQRVDLPSSTLPLSTSIPPSPRKPTNPYSLYSMLRKKV